MSDRDLPTEVFDRATSTGVFSKPGAFFVPRVLEDERAPARAREMRLRSGDIVSESSLTSSSIANSETALSIDIAPGVRAAAMADE